MNKRNCQILFAEPHSGMTSFTNSLIKEFNLHEITAGELFRSELKKNSELANQIKSFLHNGMLVPNNLIFQLIKEEILSIESDILMINFPREEIHYDLLLQLLEELNFTITYIWHLKIQNIDFLAQKIYEENVTYFNKFDETKESIKDLILYRTDFMDTMIKFLNNHHRIFTFEIDYEKNNWNYEVMLEFIRNSI